MKKILTLTLILFPNQRFSTYDKGTIDFPFGTEIEGTKRKLTTHIVRKLSFLVDGRKHKLELFFFDGRYKAAVDGGAGKGSYRFNGQGCISGLDGDCELGR